LVTSINLQPTTDNKHPTITQHREYNKNNPLPINEMVVVVAVVMVVMVEDVIPEMVDGRLT
jgi:hypothetical protein